MTPTPDPCVFGTGKDAWDCTTHGGGRPTLNREYCNQRNRATRRVVTPTPDPAASALAAAITTAFTHEGMGPDDFDEWWLTPRGFGDRYAEPILAALREAGWTLVPAEGAADER